MSVHQKGLQVLGTRAIGLILLLYSFILLFGALLLLVYATVSRTFNETTFVGVFLNVFQALALAWLASFLLCMFPDMQLYGDHIRIKVLFFEYKVAKVKIYRIIKNPTFDRIAILYEGKGHLFNLLYGLFYFKTWNQAVIMLSTDERDLNAVIDFLRKE